ncbi:hypothetical protein DICPUDRAFT_81297 [Dictyostelium purpureum]|uniref:Cytochrome P450 family protein n=1 Tax=Dictyostelium purpureum TaxID=5786 RepID=F0ZT26_DICPU|nr:uncharacterized protein DICPUDRAFT_81297 [Dictyostelium purpureum]EGC32922.1 hypothetical protein DICPUDRAFT_81297 [Dictyostelium purpureum]|eukprot:XP_003290570.1 hypothetical protein DICPUDRAFT_81297 [Dictyostelium purpureum]
MVFVFIFLFLIIYFFHKLLRSQFFNSNKNESFLQQIPGPFNFPIIGGVYLLDRNNLHLSFDKLYKKYGKIFSIKFGVVNTVVLNEPDIIFEAFHKNANFFSDRYMLPSINILSGNGSNIAFSNGEYWKKIRSEFSSLITKSKNKNLETEFNKHYFNFENFLSGYIKKNDTIYIKPFIMTYTFNVVYGLIFNESVEYEQELIPKEISDFIQSLFDVLKETTLCPDYLPFLIYFKNYDHLKEMTKKMIANVNPKIKKILNEMDESNPKTLLENLIVSIKNDKDNILKIEHLDHIVVDLILAGMETTGGVIEWMVLNLTNNIDIQNKLYKELLSNNFLSYPSINEASNYPYFNACVKETMRRSPIASMGPPRLCTKDIEIGGYIIPKGTQIFSNLYSYSFSEKFHKDPFLFKPERFIECPNTPILIFNLGSRQCPAKGMAESEIFAFGTKLFKKFLFTSPNDQVIDDKPLFHVSLTPKKWLVKITER